MQLNAESKDELRKKIEDELKSVPEGQRIHLDKDKLEDLLFDKIVYDKEHNGVIKMPIWFGPFLRKIDLSEVSFEDVSWNIHTRGSSFAYIIESKHNNRDAVAAIDKAISKLYSFAVVDDIIGAPIIDFSCTNAVIDFTKSADYKTMGGVNLQDCNFAGVDLSNNDFSNIADCYIACCDLSNCHIKLFDNIKNNVETNERDYDIWGSNLSNNDFNNLHLNNTDVFDEDKYCIDFSNILTNTGINFEFDFQEIKEYYEIEFNELIHNVSGCYINGKKVLSEAEMKAIAAQKKTEYGLFKDDNFNSILNDIESQKKIAD